jgi:cellulose synthase/poly-beta-1,6-N-acetylglucosamine synthase-like glycosyltransferase
VNARSPRQLLKAVGPGIVGALSLGPLDGLISGIEHFPVPLGIYPIGVVAAYAVYRALASLEARERGSVEIRPLEQVPLIPRRDLGGSKEPWVVATDHLRVWRPSGEESVSAEPWAVGQPSAAPKRKTRFDRNLVVAFVLLIVSGMLIRHAFFFILDLVVKVVGTAVFWPRPFPAVVQNPLPTLVVPDYVLLMYLALIAAFLLAAGVPQGRRYTPEQRGLILRLIAGYLGLEILMDVAYFTVADPFFFSAFLLARAILGGVFFTAVLLTVLVLPPPVKVEARFPRDRGALYTFVGSWLVAGALGVGFLYVLYHTLGLGRLGVAFGVLLLLPIFTFIAWTFLGRILYIYELRVRPPKSIAEYHPKVSIIIPAYNEELTIASAVRSADLAARRYPGEVEILVGNDGSADRTSGIARAAIKRLENSTGAVVDLPHGGKSNALNGVLRVATGEVVVRIDADARISPSVGFDKIVGHLAQPSVGGVQGTILPLQEEGWTRRLRFMEIAWTHLFLRRATMATRTAQVVDGAFCAFRRADLLAVGGWVAWNGEDTEITLRLQRMGYRMRFETEALAYEDVPATYDQLERQRIRWFRGGLFAHHRHLSSIFSDTPEYGGLAIAFWLALFLRSGLRSLIYLYALAVALFLPTLLHLLIILGILFLVRGLVIAYYLARIGRWRFVPYVITWPATSAIKQHMALKSWGTMLPGSIPEFSE